MSETKHAPGPWMAHANGVSSEGEIENGGNIVCEAPVGFAASSYYWEANARLIAAAPDLLESLEDAMRWIGKLTDWEGVGDPDIDKYRAAIAKAKGETK